jgi:hypothetical protein
MNKLRDVMNKSMNEISKRKDAMLNERFRGENEGIRRANERI